jgi:hypothetical protein
MGTALRSLTLALALVAASAPAIAQETIAARITGTITDRAPRRCPV